MEVQLAYFRDVDIGRDLDSIGSSLSSGHGNTCVLPISFFPMDPPSYIPDFDQ